MARVKAAGTNGTQTKARPNGAASKAAANGTPSAAAASGALHDTLAGEGVGGRSWRSEHVDRSPAEQPAMLFYLVGLRLSRAARA